MWNQALKSKCGSLNCHEEHSAFSNGINNGSSVLLVKQCSVLNSHYIVAPETIWLGWYGIYYYYTEINKILVPKLCIKLCR